jgi:predicted protein tyrosine phosphatase
MLTGRLVRFLIVLGVVLGICASGLQAANILFISSMEGLHKPGDDAIKAFMEGMGHTVTYIDDDADQATTQAAAAAADLVFISESVNSGAVKNEITAIETPMIITEIWAWDEMGLTRTVAEGQYLVTPDIQIVDAKHPLAAGFSGTVTVLTALQGSRGPARFANGTAGSGATVIARATYADGRAYDVIFVYEKGAPLAAAPADGSPRVAAEMRICLGFDEQSYLLWNSNAYAFLEAAIKYALGTRPEVGGASNPSPISGETYVPRDVVLSWTPGEYAVKHDVYFGTACEDVNHATRTNPLGVLANRDQDANKYDPPGRLEFGQTYCWRVDEVNAAPDSTIFPGVLWSFTVEPFAWPVHNIVATASSSESGAGPQNTVNGSGLNADDLHSTQDTTMWLSNRTGSQPTWIQYEFERVSKLYEMWVWNYNVTFESILGMGIKTATIEYSINGRDWTSLGDFTFARGKAAEGYASNTTVSLGGIAAKYIRLTAKSNWGGLATQYGLSEVRFLCIPVHATEPQPAVAETGVDPTTALHWRAGREAVSHELYFSSGSQVVLNGAALAGTTQNNSYSPASLNLKLATTYYWRIDEVNLAENPSRWQGDLWSFSTRDFLPVDDFESYTNDSPHRVFQTWVDGLGFSADEFFPNGDPGNQTGSVVGYDPTAGDIMETSITHDGMQSMPVAYNNAAAPYYSEITRTWTEPQDWTVYGANTLRLYMQGSATNGHGDLCVTLQDKAGHSKTVTHANPDAVLLATTWQPWSIPLAQFTGVDAKTITKMSIGIGDQGRTTPGGNGLLHIDDIGIGSQP